MKVIQMHEAASPLLGYQASSPARKCWTKSVKAVLSIKNVESTSIVDSTNTYAKETRSFPLATKVLAEEQTVKSW